jgi:hypothetical protein
VQEFIELKDEKEVLLTMDQLPGEAGSREAASDLVRLNKES